MVSHGRRPIHLSYRNRRRIIHTLITKIKHKSFVGLNHHQSPLI